MTTVGDLILDELRRLVRRADIIILQEKLIVEGLKQLSDQVSRNSDLTQQSIALITTGSADDKSQIAELTAKLTATNDQLTAALNPQPATTPAAS